VIDDKIQNYPDTALFSLAGELNEVSGGAVPAVDAVVIGDIVTIVEIGRWLKRLKPDARNAEAGKIIQPPRQSFEISDPIAVRIHKSADVEVVDDGVLVPEIVNHFGGKICSVLRNSTIALLEYGDRPE
jgi:hypothetical protein